MRKTGPGGGSVSAGAAAVAAVAGAAAGVAGEVSGPPVWSGLRRADVSRPLMPTTVPARARGTDTDEALALTVDPDLRKVCRSVPKAFSTWAVVPLKLMVRWLAGMAPTVKPAARNQAVTAATSEARGANRARHCAGVTKAPYCALAGSETAAARDSAPAGSRRARTAVRCCCCPAGVWPTRVAWVVQAGASSSVVRGEGAAAWARAGLRPATASVTAAVALTTAPLRSVGAMSGSSRLRGC